MAKNIGKKVLKFVIGFFVLVFASLSAAAFGALFGKGREISNEFVSLEPISDNSSWYIIIPKMDNIWKVLEYFKVYWAAMVIFFVIFAVFAILAYLVLKDFGMGGQRERLERIEKAINDLPKNIAAELRKPPEIEKEDKEEE